MKKMFCLCIALFLILGMVAEPAGLAFAESSTITEPTDSPAAGTIPFSWAYLATIAGAAAFTLVVVQYTKAPLDKVWKIPTRLFAYIIAFAVMLLGTVFTSGINVESVLLAGLNAFLAATTAYGAYEYTFKPHNE